MAKRLKIKPYVDEAPGWPDRGRVILAQYDDDSAVIYQAYTPEIARFSVEHGRLGGPGFNPDLMRWIKTSFLWMMHRCQWATAPGQEAVLAIWLQRRAFDAILAQAVHSSHQGDVYPDQAAWQAALASSEVVLQWDPDYPPSGPKLRRRAIQLGLRGEILRRFAPGWIVHIEDITAFVRQQAEIRSTPDLMLTPAQRVYPVSDPAVARRLGLDKHAVE